LVEQELLRRERRMTTTGSVSRWIRGLKAGEAHALQKLWGAYCKQLVVLARKRLLACRGRAADEEDVVLSVFDTVFRRARDGEFSRLNDRHDLWQILVLITRRKAANLIKQEFSQKRGGKLARTCLDDVEELVAQGPAPQFAAQVAEECGRLLETLGKPDLKSVAVWKMEGYTNDEIADRLQRSVATVERKLALIRDIWQAEAS
jgi:DNA-directed RNA polymerase specialized sigma24 family protein